MLRAGAGISIVELVCALFVFSVALIGLTSAGVIAGGNIRAGAADVRAAMAVRYQMEQLTRQGYDSLTAGSDTVQGLAMSWDVTGTNPKRLILVVQRNDGSGGARPDTFVTYVADPTP